MARPNPFSPHFGGNPKLFFGRRPILEEFDVALVSPGSDYRSLFLTGTRGSGKTCLVERLSSRAAAAGWDVLDLTADHALRSLLRRLAPFDEVTRSVDPHASLEVMGTGLSFGGMGRTESRRIDPADLTELFLEGCRRAKRGIFVSIDEVQKVPLDDVSAICSAFQMASRKGLDAILVVAGLPLAYRRVIEHDGCTFMRRARHVRVGLLDPREVREGLGEGFARAGVEVLADALDELVAKSLGQPYLMQLLGYEVVRGLREPGGGGPKAQGGPSAGEPAGRSGVSGEPGRQPPGPVTLDAAADAFGRAYGVYAQQALRPIVHEIGARCLDYLRAMVARMDESHEVQTRLVAEELRATPGSLARTREKLLGQGIILSPRRGWVRFNVPYLRDYVATAAYADDEARLNEYWDI